MTAGLRPSLAAILLLAATPAVAQGLSPNVGRPLQQATRLAASGSTAAALAQVSAARSAADTAEERRKVAETAAYVYTRAGQFGQAAAQLETIGASPRQLAGLYYNSGQFDKAMAAAKRAGGADMQVVVAQSYLRKNNPKAAIDIYQNLIRTSGPRAEWLQNLAGAQYQSGDRAGYIETTRQLIRVDPSPARWRALLGNMRNQNMSNESKLALYQLMAETGNLIRAEDYQDMAKLAILGNQPGVARRNLRRAVEANVVQAGDPMTARLIQAANNRAQRAEAQVGRLPQTGPGFMQAGYALFGAEQYPRAAAVFGRAIQAGAPEADQARVLAGIALLRAGNAGGARQQFGSVPAGSAFKDIAELWSLYASTRAA